MFDGLEATWISSPRVADPHPRESVGEWIGIIKLGCDYRQPSRHAEAVELTTLAWVDWSIIGGRSSRSAMVPPAKYEERYYQQAAMA